MHKTYFVYILSNVSKTLYVGMSSNLPGRLEQHQAGCVPSFTQKYHIWKLVYAEAFEDVYAAIEREKQIKRWRRDKKLALIYTANPEFVELPPH